MKRVQRPTGMQRLGRLFVIRGDQRGLVENLNKANTSAFELVITPLVFAAIGFFLDGAIGTRPLLAFALGFVGLGGAVLRVYYDYVARMKLAEQGKPWART